MKVSLLGVGLMGFPVGRRLCQAGFQLDAWNRTATKADRLLAFGAKTHSTPAAAVADADIVIALLDHGAVVGNALFDQGVAAAMKKGGLFIDMSSIKPAEARDHAARLSELGVDHMDAPVSGGTVGADMGSLAIMVGGSNANFGRALPVIQHLGRATHVGPTGAGQLAKLANQMIVGITIGAVAEALLFCERGGANMAKVQEAITGGFADSRILQVHGRRMIERNFAPHARMTVQQKDLRNALATAQEIGFDAPITRLFEQLNTEAITHGLADYDHSALFIELASRNGVT